MTTADQYTIVFTDSGLGGLSIMVDYYNTIKEKSIAARNFNIIFFNALQESGNGYNNMSTTEEKINTFNGALETIRQRHNPDKIAIACNTLSSIYPQTAFSRSSENTLEIISCGVAQIKKQLEQFPDVPVFVLATPTTLASNAYKIESENIFYISGDNLASLIEFNYMMPELKSKISEMFAEMTKSLQNKTELALFFGCTHYAYVSNLFREVAQESGLYINNIIDPAQKFNKLLIDELDDITDEENHEIKINVQIESQAKILDEEISSVSSMIKEKSAEITSLLKNYTRLPKTF
jgi:glutamate racemase